ncbi:MAG: hypothetical protein ACLR9H_03260 [Bifidobacterium breve]
MLSQNRNLSQKLVVEEHIDRMRTYFSGNVTSEGQIRVFMDIFNDLTVDQARFIAKALEELADRAEEFNE